MKPSKLDIALSNCKSVVRIDDPKDIKKRLVKKFEERGTDYKRITRETDEGLCWYRPSLHSAVIRQHEATPEELRIPESMKLRELVEKIPGLKWNDSFVERSQSVWGSDERVDAHGDIVRQRWHFDLFEKNSPMPFSHEWHRPPVGRHIEWNVRQRNDPDYQGPALHLLSVFAPEGAWEWADSVARLVTSGIMVSNSVGLISDSVIDVEDAGERQKLGLPDHGVILDENHLLENSPTTLPANEGAHVTAKGAVHLYETLRTARDAGNLKSYDMHLLREMERSRIHGKQHDVDEWFQSEEMLLQIAKTLWPKETFKLHKELDVPVLLEEKPESKSEEEVSAFESVALHLENLSIAMTEGVSSAKVILEDIRGGIETLLSRAPQSKEIEDDDDEEADDSIIESEEDVAFREQLERATQHLNHLMPSAE